MDITKIHWKWEETWDAMGKQKYYLFPRTTSTWSWRKFFHGIWISIGSTRILASYTFTWKILPDVPGINHDRVWYPRGYDTRPGRTSFVHFCKRKLTIKRSLMTRLLYKLNQTSSGFSLKHNINKSNLYQINSDMPTHSKHASNSMVRQE